jgi:hypothetical protein
LQPDHFEHPLQVLKKLVIPEPQDSEPIAPQAGVSGIVIEFTSCMLAAVEFYHQFRGERQKVDDIFLDRLLAPEFYPFDLRAAQVLPEESFCIGAVAPQALSIRK